MTTVKYWITVKGCSTKPMSTHYLGPGGRAGRVSSLPSGFDTYNRRVFNQFETSIMEAVLVRKTAWRAENFASRIFRDNYERRRRLQNKSQHKSASSCSKEIGLIHQKQKNYEKIEILAKKFLKVSHSFLSRQRFKVSRLPRTDTPFQCQLISPYSIPKLLIFPKTFQLRGAQ